MDNESSTTETVEAPPGTEVTPSGGIITRADGGTTPPGASDWRSSLPPELQAEPTLAKYKSVEEALKGAVHAQKLVGRLEVPAADAKPEVVAEYRKRAGIPESPDKYDVKMPEPPEGSGMHVDEKLLGTFLKSMHAAHARPEQVQAALDVYGQHMAQMWDRMRNDHAQAEGQDAAAVIAELEKKWGPKDGPMWKHHLGRADLAVRTFMADAPPSAVQRIVDQINGDAELAHAWSLAADALLERGFLGEDEMPSALGSEDAQRKADEIRDAASKDPRHPLNDPNHPEHERVLKNFLEYNAVAAGPRGREVVAEVRR